MLEFAWPWAFALLPLPILIWWWLPPYRARQASVQVPFFERLAAAAIAQMPMARRTQAWCPLIQRRVTSINAERWLSFGPVRA